MGPGAVHANAKHLRIEALELRQVVTEAHMLVGAHRAEIKRIKGQDDVLPLQIAKLVFLVIVSSKAEIRCRLAYRDRHDRSLLFTHPWSSFKNCCSSPGPCPVNIADSAIMSYAYLRP